MNIERLYKVRFSDNELDAKIKMWKILCDHFFSQFINPSDTVVDLGAGYCEFINNIKCAHKIAIDLNPDIKKFALPEVIVINEPCTTVRSLLDNSVDVVFMSNFLEHLTSKSLVVETIHECRRILKPGGKIMILQPNIRFLSKVYWDFFDHHIPLSDRSLSELLESASFVIRTMYPRFLPYTTKSRLPKGGFFILLYLRCRWVWPILGKQVFVVAEK